MRYPIKFYEKVRIIIAIMQIFCYNLSTAKNYLQQCMNILQGKVVKKNQAFNTQTTFERLKDCVEIIEPKNGLEEKLKEARPLTVKLGFDPTAPDLHLGHAVVLRKIKQFQDEGHKVVIIIGDYTAKIGDPTGRNTTRPELNNDQIKDNAQTYMDQLGKILDVNKVTVSFNSQWLGKKDLADIVKLMGQVTLAQVLQRNDFAKRFESGTPIFMHEMLYPLMQGLDSVEIQADIEMGGTDQLFNNMMGRHLQEKRNMPAQVALCMPILPGTDGREKMGKSKGNYIGLTEPPIQMYGKVMSIPDFAIPQYLDLATNFSADERKAIKDQMAQSTFNPMEAKLKIAFNVVEQYHGQEHAEFAANHFDKTVRKKELHEENIPAFDMKDIADQQDGITALKLGKMIKTNDSNSKIRRLIEAGAMKVNGQKIDNFDFVLPLKGEDTIVQLGKRGIIKITREPNNLAPEHKPTPL